MAQAASQVGQAVLLRAARVAVVTAEEAEKANKADPPSETERLALQEIGARVFFSSIERSTFAVIKPSAQSKIGIDCMFMIAV